MKSEFLSDWLLNIAVKLLPIPTPIPFDFKKEATPKPTINNPKRNFQTTKEMGVPYTKTTDEKGNIEFEILQNYNGRSKSLTKAEIEFLTNSYPTYDREIYLNVKREYAKGIGRRTISKNLLQRHGRNKGYSENNVRRYMKKIKELTGEKQVSPLVK